MATKRVKSGVTITPQQRYYYSKRGQTFIKEGLVSGFQLEDYAPRNHNRKRTLYGHDNIEHLNEMKARAGGGRIYPRESYYKWDTDWDVGDNVRLLRRKTLARANEKYFESTDPRAIGAYNRYAFRSRSVHPIRGAYYVPDIRAYNGAGNRRYKTAYQVTKRLDDDSRLSMLVTREAKMKELRKRLRGERVQRVRLQDYPRRSRVWREKRGVSDTDPSLWNFVDSIYSKG